MKKIIFILLTLVVGLGCGPTTFNHSIIKKSTINNPSFAIHIAGSNNDWLYEQIENTIMERKLTVIALYTNTVDQKTTTVEGKGLLWGVGVETKTKSGDSIDLTKINATYLIIANYDLYQFRIILVKTQEVVAKGTFTGNSYIKNNINTVLNEMGIVE